MCCGYSFSGLSVRGLMFSKGLYVGGCRYVYVWMFRRGVVGRLSRGYWPSATTSYEIRSTVMSIRKQRMLAFLISSFTMWYREVHIRFSSLFCEGRRCVIVFTKIHHYYEPAESVPQFSTRLSTILFILALFMLSANKDVSKMNCHVLKRLEFDPRKGKYFPASCSANVAILYFRG